MQIAHLALRLPVSGVWIIRSRTPEAEAAVRASERPVASFMVVDLPAPLGPRTRALPPDYSKGQIVPATCSLSVLSGYLC